MDSTYHRFGKVKTKLSLVNIYHMKGIQLNQATEKIKTSVVKTLVSNTLIYPNESHI